MFIRGYGLGTYRNSCWGGVGFGFREFRSLGWGESKTKKLQTSFQFWGRAARTRHNLNGREMFFPLRISCDFKPVVIWRSKKWTLRNTESNTFFLEGPSWDFRVESFKSQNLRNLGKECGFLWQKLFKIGNLPTPQIELRRIAKMNPGKFFARYLQMNSI